MRLLPRFSLRFALLALTIFLILFGVVVSYWKEYQQHEAIVERLLNLDWSVEEEPVKLFGIVIGKRLTGLISQQQMKPDYLQPFFELPRPQDLRRFVLFVTDDNMDDDSVQKKQSLERLQLSPYLERLQTSWLPKETDYEQLALFKELRILDLTQATIPPGRLKFLEQLPHLEVLRLDSRTLQWNELCQLSFPRLKILVVDGSIVPELRLTRDGWGRSPKLEAMVFGVAAIQKVVCEPGAMPNLRGLDLGFQEADCEIDWDCLPETAPRLARLSLPNAHYDELKKVLRRLPYLKEVLLGTNLDQPRRFSYENFELAKVALADEPTKSPSIRGDDLTLIIGSGQRLDTGQLYREFREQLLTGEFSLTADFEWPSPYWHPKSAHLQGGFF